jgi:hypothetical protein
MTSGRTRSRPPYFSSPRPYHEARVTPEAGLYKVMVWKLRDGDWTLETIYVGQSSNLRTSLDLNTHPSAAEWFVRDVSRYGLYVSIAEMPAADDELREQWLQHCIDRLRPVCNVMLPQRVSREPASDASFEAWINDVQRVVDAHALNTK